MIRSKARFLHEEKCKEMELPPTFTASNGWVQKFMTRHWLCIRRKTTESQKDPGKLIDKLIAYVLQARRLRVKLSYSDSDIIAMDETAVWQDMLSNTTVDSIGHNTIAMKTTGQEKTKVSVCLTAKADGTKLKPFIVFPGAKRETKLLNAEFKAKCVVASSSNGWMNEELTLDWVRNCSGEVFFHPTNLGVGFVQVPRDGNSQTRTTHVKDRSFNHPRGLCEIHSSARRGFEKAF